MATPQQDTEMEEPQPPLPSMGATPLFQPIPVERDASFTMAAAQVGVDINSDADLQAYLATPLTTRAQVLDTIRHTMWVLSGLRSLTSSARWSR